VASPQIGILSHHNYLIPFLSMDIWFISSLWIWLTTEWSIFFWSVGLCLHLYLSICFLSPRWNTVLVLRVLTHFLPMLIHFHLDFYWQSNSFLIFFSSSIFLKFLFYSYVHTMFGSFLPPSPTPSLTPPPAPFLFPHSLNTRQKLFYPYL
jgi:hypothetical protein